MATRLLFPGMDPYLQHPNRWPEVYYGLIAELQESLNQQITPRYRAAVEKRVYTDLLPVIVPDAKVFQQFSKALQESSSVLSRTGETLVLS